MRIPARPPFAALFLALALCLPAAAYVGQWHSYTNKTHVTSLIAHQGYVYAGTQGGIRRVDPATLAQIRYDNLDGLLDVWIAGLAKTADSSLWAASHDGYLYVLKGNAWEIWGRSYASLGWRVNDRAFLAAGSYLYLGTEKGLAVFDAGRKISQLNLTRFGGTVDLPVLSLLRREDTLYLGTSGGVYKARVNFADPVNPPAGYGNLAEPGTWIAESLPADPNRKYNSLAFVDDTLATFGPGTLLQAPAQSPVRVEAFAGAPLVIGNQPAYIGWNDFAAALYFGGKVFAGGSTSLVISAHPDTTVADIAVLAAPDSFPRDTVANIGAYGGNVWGQASSGLWRLNPSNGNFDAVPSLVTSPSPELYVRFLRNVTVDANADVYVASWGGGLVLHSHDGTDRFWKHTTDTCIHSAAPSDPYMVAFSLSKPRDDGLYFTLFRTEGGTEHQLIHLNTATGEISCPEAGLSVPGGYPHGILAFSDTLLGVATERGVDFFKIRAGTVPVLESKGLWTTDGSANEAWDLAQDKWGRPWALIGTGLAYLDSLDQSTSRKLKFIDNFTGENCKSLESDPSGLLWIGCENGLYQVQTTASGDLGQVRRYGMDDGLLSLFIYDVSVDPLTGRVWVATDRGVSMLESASQPPVAGGGSLSVSVYPNPFRPQHAFVIFDHLPRNATLRLTDATGSVVRIFRPGDLNGNQAQWDGKNEGGKRVAPGVYLYSVVSGSAVARGKIIVAR